MWILCCPRILMSEMADLGDDDHLGWELDQLAKLKRLADATLSESGRLGKDKTADGITRHGTNYRDL